MLTGRAALAWHWTLTGVGCRDYARRMDGQTEKILLEQIREGNAESFESLVRHLSPRALRLAVRLTGNRAEAEEIAQEAFLRFYTGIHSFRGESSVGTWLYQTVTRLAIDHLRRERLRRRIFFFRRDEESADPMEVIADPAPSPADRVLATEACQRLSRALGKLPPRQRAVFVLRHQEELPLKEIADLLGLGEGTVKAHLHRAVQRLRKELTDGKEAAP
jgi:RNA polymerase sigma-70 factor (ECF subfamily)